ncbi:MAG: 3-hydroxyacyl-CoA dehydrogenase NAD-binding domain-containing protein [Bacteroidia bacterium]|nr:3-hydroxyacyl-CoA dehydrogenase NAD-binding domain-containing protein [Bacteroidia bacterium]
MEITDVQQIAVLGAGVMGSGIAVTAARAGYQVQVYDPAPGMADRARTYAEKFLGQAVEKQKMTAEAAAAALDRMQYIGSLDLLAAELVIEAVPESLSLKHQALRLVEERLPADAIIASNTSTLPVTRIAAGLTRPARVGGLHFFNPAPVMKLVEVIAGIRTDADVPVLLMELARRLGKTPVQVADTPGFIVNRVARQYYLESLRITEEQGASFDTIDRLMKATGFSMGPFELMDLIGLDTNHAVSQSVYEAFFQEPRFRPSRLQQHMVDAGLLGRKTGKGFYAYE